MSNLDFGPVYDGHFLINVTKTDFSGLESARSLYGSSFDQSTFGFQDAISPVQVIWSEPPKAGFKPSIYLFSDGCDENGVQDCTKSCSDPTIAFSNPRTFHNCMAYPLAAKIYSEGNITANTPDSMLLDALKIQKSPEGSELLNNITKTMGTCLQDLCKKFPLCEEYIAQYDRPSVFNSTKAFYYPSDGPNVTSDAVDYNSSQLITQVLYQVTNGFCNSQRAGLNADIGGIGVFISYWIQSGLALLGCLAVLWWKWGLRYCSFVVYSLRFRYRDAKEHSQTFTARLGNKHLPAITSALVEFQKAQCFFMLAINIAALFNKRRGGFQPTSLQQLYNNYTFIKAISISGFLPITFTLLTLSAVDLVSWYLMNLSVLTVAISTATLVDLGIFSPSQADLDFLSQLSTSSGPPSCGNPNILVYCLVHPYSDFGSPDVGILGMEDVNIHTGASTILGFCMVVLVLLVLNQAKVLESILKLRLKTSLSKTKNFLIFNFLGIRGFQLALATILCVLETLLDFLPVFSSSELGLLLYVFIASDLHYTARKNAAGKIYSKWAVLFADTAAFIFSLLNLIFRSYFDHYNSIYAGAIIAICVVLLSSFTFSFILTSIHVHKIRTRQLRRKKSRHQYPAYLRRISAVFLSGWQRTRSMFLNAQSPAFVSRISRLKRNIKSITNISNSTIKLAPIFVFVVYVSLFATYIYWFTIYFALLTQFGDSVDFSAWTFGQIVAITVWAQPLCEYFHLELRGMQRGFQHRLLWPYKVVLREEDEEMAQDRVNITALGDDTRDSAVDEDSILRERSDSTLPFMDSTAHASLTPPAVPAETFKTAGMEEDPSAELIQETHDPHETVELASLSDVDGLSHESWQIPESVLNISSETSFV